MGISARGPLPAWVDRLFGKRSMGWRNRSTDRDRHNRRCAVQIDRQGGCPGRRAGEHGHGRSRGGEAEVQYWSLRRTDSDHDVSIPITIGDVAGRWRGEEPRLNVSMMIMRPPQHGHGCESGFGSLEDVASAVLDDAMRWERVAFLKAPKTGAGRDNLVVSAGVLRSVSVNPKNSAM